MHGVAAVSIGICVTLQPVLEECIGDGHIMDTMKLSDCRRTVCVRYLDNYSGITVAMGLVPLMDHLL